MATEEKALNEELKEDSKASSKETKKSKKADKKTDVLAAEKEKLEKELADTKDSYMRVLAEYDNFRKRSQREKESAEWSRNMRQIVRDVENREQNRVNDFLTKHKDALDKGRETVRREQNKSYFS